MARFHPVSARRRGSSSWGAARAPARGARGAPRHHSLESGANDAACRRTAEIVVDRLDLAPAKRNQPVAHGVLQRAALPVVQNLVSGGLADIEDRFPLQMMWPNLLRYHGAPSSVEDGDRQPRDRR